MIDRDASVRELDAREWAARDLLFHALEDRRDLCLSWSPRTGELFTWLPAAEGPDVLVEVLGRLDTFEQADALVAAAGLPLAEGGQVRIDAVRNRLRLLGQ